MVFERLEYDAEYGYFNAGVLLVNLKYWRDNNLTNAFLEYMSSHSDKLKTHDQDVLNALLHDKCKHVSRKWNTEEAFYHYYVIKKWQKNEFKRNEKSSFQSGNYTLFMEAEALGEIMQTSFAVKVLFLFK